MKDKIKVINREMFYSMFPTGRRPEYEVFPAIPGLSPGADSLYYYSIGQDNKVFAIDPITEKVIIPSGEGAETLYSLLQEAAEEEDALKPWNWSVTKISDQVTYILNEFCRVGYRINEYHEHYLQGTYLLKETTNWGTEKIVEIKNEDAHWNNEIYSYLCFEEISGERLTRKNLTVLHTFYKNIFACNGKEYSKTTNIGS